MNFDLRFFCLAELMCLKFDVSLWKKKSLAKKASGGTIHFYHELVIKREKLS